MKHLKNLGKALNKVEQKQIFGGTNRLTKVDSGDGCSYEHHDRCLDGTPCQPGDFCNGHGCGHWFMVC